MQAYSERTHTSYPSWDALVEAEANGHVVVAIITDDKGNSWPYVMGPFAEKRRAQNVRASMRRKWSKEVRDRVVDPRWTASFFVRPAWKQD